MRGMTRRVGLAAAMLLATLGIGESADAGLVIRSLAGNRRIEIPVFDQSLGTLVSANLRIEMLSGTTSFGGNHWHAEFESDSGVTSASGLHNHQVSVPGYGGGGLFLGGFSFLTGAVGAHQHSYSTGGGSTSSAGTHSHSFFTSGRNFLYSGAGLSPFLASSDFSIWTGDLTASVAGVHSHDVTNASGAHNHSIAPNWRTTATFSFTPVAAVPEPSTLISGGVAGIFGLGLACFKRRRKLAAVA